jgi:hypothetical protein
MDFDARITAGTQLVTWVDFPTGSAPSRINPYPEHQQTYYRATNHVAVTIKAKVDGVEEPLDTVLGGRLFYAKWAEWPGNMPPPAVTSPPGQSSVMTFIPVTPGHYLFVIRREGGGGIAIPFEVV